jgi:hypothetical protein
MSLSISFNTSSLTLGVNKAAATSGTESTFQLKNEFSVVQQPQHLILRLPPDLARRVRAVVQPGAKPSMSSIEVRPKGERKKQPFSRDRVAYSSY